MNWHRVKLGEVCESILDGTHGSPQRTETGIPVLSAQNVKDGFLNFTTNRFTSELEYQAFSKRGPLQKGDVLLTIVGTIGRSAVIDEVKPLVFQRSVAIIRPKRPLYSRFLFHLTQDADFRRQLDSATNQSSQAGVYLGKLKQLEIPLPPLEEQKRIASILDQADALRRVRRKSLERLDELAQSLFLELFGDPATNPKRWAIGSISEITNSINYGTSQKSEAEGEFPYLRMNNITYTGEWNFSDLKYITLSEKDKAKYLVQHGDILFNRTNSAELVGKTATYRRTEPMAFAGYLIRVRLNEKHHPEYVSAFLNSKHTKGLLRGMCKSIIGMANINAKELGSIKIPLPPLALQQTFAAQIEELEAIKTRARTQLLELDALFASLQERAFSGQL